MAGALHPYASYDAAASRAHLPSWCRQVDKTGGAPSINSSVESLSLQHIIAPRSASETEGGVSWGQTTLRRGSLDKMEAPPLDGRCAPTRIMILLASASELEGGVSWGQNTLRRNLPGKMEKPQFDNRCATEMSVFACASETKSAEGGDGCTVFVESLFYT